MSTKITPRNAISASSDDLSLADARRAHYGSVEWLPSDWKGTLRSDDPFAVNTLACRTEQVDALHLLRPLRLRLELEQSFRVGATDLESIVLADRASVEPWRDLQHRFVRIID